jgi:N-glycosylase/DNA lyase
MELRLEKKNEVHEKIHYHVKSCKENATLLCVKNLLNYNIKKEMLLTNWTPVSLRIPIPAEAKLAPTSNLSPSNSGLKYGNVGSDPIFSPISHIHILIYSHLIN